MAVYHDSTTHPACRHFTRAGHRVLPLLWLLLLAAVCHTARAEPFERLVDRLAATYGGQEHLAEVTAFQQHGVTWSAMRGHKGHIHRAYQFPDRLRIEIIYSENDNELRVLMGPRAWKKGKAVKGTFYSAMLLQAARLGLPHTLLTHREKLQDGGDYVSRAGTTLRGVELPFHGNLRLTAGVDPQTGRILESRGTIGAPGKAMEFITVYDDFRMVEGRLFAFREAHYAMGRPMGRTQIERIEVMDELPEELFDETDPDTIKPGMHVVLGN